MFLIQDHVEDILIRKRSIRINYSPDWGGRVVKWYDGKNIEWVPLAMNLVHSAVIVRKRAVTINVVSQNAS